MTDLPPDRPLVLGARTWTVCAPASADDLQAFLDENDPASVAVVVNGRSPQAQEILALAVTRGVPLLLAGAAMTSDARAVAEADLAAHGCHAAPELATTLLVTSRRLALTAAPRLDLSDRERTILELVAQGESNRFIASQLFLSEHTVRNHLSRMFRKLGVSTRGEAAQALRDERAPAAVADARQPEDGSTAG